MAQNSHSDEQQTQSTRSGLSVESREAPRMRSDEWSHVRDANERRKIQNRLSQRRFRDKLKDQKQETEREVENQQRAGSSYATPDPDDIDPDQDLSGLPWGGISMKHIVKTGRTKEQYSHQKSQGNYMHASTSRTDGGSSRLGLRLPHQFAQAYPAWMYLKYSPYQYLG
ncbi:hypothetical protein P153DRAFT_353194 [Dothidotthia symphoricarpi CBS 119687]|uniref:BZIP domain-containing protein n=1 Tax=Dothidotthia symphoricarpi CBS 119687 TaxID=1392245 RepID=A0A6A6AS44_9PLEO|nr:uncharacterized protein P153DRAFT_353194 [Dothidotthia symphoricarpi CBS 119687]KAF2133978.1 hypothetical protein P153DRAFT_353194 [Dothidotthia symphoricarpi CBS 119687]